MTTLLEAAKRLITSLHLDRFDIEDWPEDSREAYVELKQAIEREKATVKEPLTDQSCETCKHDSVPRVGRCYSCQSGMTGELRNWEPKP